MENQVINCIASALGVRLFQPINLNSVRYLGGVYVTADADEDG